MCSSWPNFWQGRLFILNFLHIMMMASPQAVWEIVKVVHGHPRFRIGFLSLSGCVLLRYTVWNLFQYWRTQRNGKARRKLAHERKELVKEQCADVDPEEIFNKPIDELLKDLKSGALTAVQVLQAFQKRALDLDATHNMIVEPVPEALDQAKELDQASDKNGLLYGMPVSIKENMSVAGYDSTGGVSFYINMNCKEDSVVVKVLKKHGAIPFVRTNIPQTMMSLCSSNPIYGETLNPHDHTRGPGGSSSGEGSLIGSGGSFMGVGSDIGGSIRVPAAFCGCYSLKPTNRRVSFKGVFEINKGSLAIQSNACPIAKDWKSLLYLSKALMSKDMYDMDPQIPCLPFDQKEVDKTGPMVIGYYTFDGNIKCQPAVVRAVMEAKAALEKLGHTLVPIDITSMSPPGFNEGKFFIRLCGADSLRAYKNVLYYDKREKSVQFLYLMFLFPIWFRKMLSFVLSFKDKFASQVLSGTFGFKSLFEYQRHIEELRLYQDQFTDAWMERRLDAIICPVFPSAAPKKKYMHLLSAAAVYCQLYNTLNYPSGVIPVTKVTKKDVEDTMNPSVFKPTTFSEKLLMKSVEGSEGMPITIQCVTLPFKEETCLRVMREVETGLHKEV